jgi:DNA-binding MarR family transcriptional regulator
MSLQKENYIVIPAFVVMPISEGGLGLKGNEAWVYAIIYGFSQDGESWFEGSQGYLADWCNSTTRGIRKNLEALIAKGLIEKREGSANGRLVYDYRVLHSSSYRNKVPTSAEQSLHHIIEDNITPSDIDSNESISSPPKGKSASFVAPSIDDVLAYCAEHEFSIDPYEFFDHYQGNGWMAGKVKMKDWKATLRNWERRKRKGESYR